MNVAVVGTGYVGLVTGTCLAERGNDVVCVDIDADKVRRMQAGEVPIYEPGLEEMFRRNMADGRLKITTDLQKGVADALVIFLALPTPTSVKDGSADLSFVLGVADDLGKMLKKYAVVVDKSTVPVGTARKVRGRIAANARSEFDVVSNPEFLREGQAVSDFMHPDRIVIGADSEKAATIMKRLYRPFVRRDPAYILVTDPESAEMIKYGANALLSTKITFMNELSGLCEATGADVEAVREGMSMDGRIGHFLYPGPGYGGSCFPKDTRALWTIGQEYNQSLRIVEATIKANEAQKEVLPSKVIKYYKNNLKGKTFALWGLAFKDNTDDIRESPALVVVEKLTKLGANIVAFDPKAMDNTRRVMGDNQRLSFAENHYAALHDADALIIATNWVEFDNPDFAKMKQLLKQPVIFDGRNRYELEVMKEQGFHYESIGRKVIRP